MIFSCASSLLVSRYAGEYFNDAGKKGNRFASAESQHEFTRLTPAGCWLSSPIQSAAMATPDIHPAASNASALQRFIIDTLRIDTLRIDTLRRPNGNASHEASLGSVWNRLDITKISR